MAEIILKLLDTKRIIPIGKSGFEINVENKNGGMVIAGENNVSMLHLVFTKEFLQNNKDKINTDDEIVVTILNANNEYTIVNESYDEANVTTSGTWLMDVPITSAMTFVGYTKVFIQWKSANNSIFVWERFDLKVWSTDPNYIPGTGKKYVPADFVEANPSGEPTKDLSTIKIDDTIYNIPEFEAPTFTNSTIWTQEFIDKVRKVGYAVYHSTANTSQLYSVCAKNLPGKDITLMTINYTSHSILIYGISLNGTIELSVTQKLVIYSDDGRIERVATPINNSDAANKTYVDTNISEVNTYAQNTQQELNELKASLYGYVFGEDTANFSKLDISALPSMINNNNVAYNTRLMLDTIKGRTVKWTQLVNPAGYPSTKTVSGVTFTFNKTNGTITVNGTATEDIACGIYSDGAGLHVLCSPKDYVYLKGCPSGGSESTYYLIWANAWDVKDFGSGYYNKLSIFTDTTVVYCNPEIIIKSGVTMTNKVFRPQLFNVSDIYGLGKEPATKEDFNKDYPLQVYPYGNADIKPTKVSGIKIKAGYKNLLNVFANTTIISGVTITKNNDGTYTCNGTASEDIECLVASAQNINVSSKINYVEILLQGCPANGSTNTYYLRNNWSYSNDIGNGVINHITYKVAPINITVSIVIKQGTTCNNLIFKPQLINLTNTYGLDNEPTTVAQFNQDFPDIDNIPYPEQTISFAEQTLYGINDISKTKDELNIVKKGNVYELQFTKRMSVISDMSLQNWTYSPADIEYGPSFSLRFDNSTGSQGYGDYPTVLCPKYTTSIISEMINKKYNKSITNTLYYFFIIDKDYTDVASFKKANEGVPLYYTLANPTTTTLATLTKNQVTALFTKGYCVEILGNDDNKVIVRPDLSLNMVIKLIGGNTNE